MDYIFLACITHNLDDLLPQSTENWKKSQQSVGRSWPSVGYSTMGIYGRSILGKFKGEHSLRLSINYMSALTSSNFIIYSAKFRKFISVFTIRLLKLSLPLFMHIMPTYIYKSQYFSPF